LIPAAPCYCQAGAGRGDQSLEFPKIDPIAPQDRCQERVGKKVCERGFPEVFQRGSSAAARGSMRLGLVGHVGCP